MLRRSSMKRLSQRALLRIKADAYVMRERPHPVGFSWFSPALHLFAGSRRASLPPH